MIYTITLNPSIDHYVFLNSDLVTCDTNRAKKTADLCGGKGINVSIVCKKLGLKTVCTGFAGGFTGDEILRQLNGYGIDTRFVRIEGTTRINTKIVCGGAVTEINAASPEIKQNETEELLNMISGLSEKDTVVLSGSVPDTPGLLVSVLDAIKKTGARLTADTSGKALKTCLEYSPFLIKPNRAELAAHFGLDKDIYIPEYAEKLLAYAKNVIISDGENGAYHLNKNGCRYLPVTDMGYKSRNTTGAGDSMIAGYLYGEQNGIDPFITAVSAGSASAYSEELFDKNIFYTVIKSYI